jgi:sulfonate transport system permease protein
MTPRYVLAAVSVYFPAMTAATLGLSLADPRAVDVVRAYGGGAGAVMRLVRLRALPAIMGGFQVAAPNAVLGAILAEFGGGRALGPRRPISSARSGAASPARLWAHRAGRPR